MSAFARTLGALLVFVAVGSASPVDAAPALQDLAALAGDGQGVYAVSADGEILVAQAADLPVHPASVSKIATSLALLERLGPEHRFTTRLRGAGPLRAGTLEGDLVLTASGDPFFVDESAFLLLARLHAEGLRTVAGRLRVEGPLLFNWQPDPDGRRLRRALAGMEGLQAWAVVARATGAPSLRETALAFRDETRDGGTGGETLAVYRSPPLLHLVKVLNGYSNNVFHFAADTIGGTGAVESIARAHVPPGWRDEITIDNGAGAGTTNRLSPRAAVALLGALAERLAESGHDLPDALPVSGIDPGTLRERFPEHPGTVVGKTGTFGSVGASALTGALRTRRFGIVRFAVLNHDVPVPEARRRQDDLVRALIAIAGGEPWPTTAPTHPDYLAALVEPGPDGGSGKDARGQPPAGEVAQ
jgi:D-alanyl-D-alanine carboxypeptidase